jgi:DNA-binding transcriptional MerR regulator
VTSTIAPVGVSIAGAAELTGLSAHTLRYYEREGLLLSPVSRDSSGHRRYREEDLGWVTMITRLRATGMPIREIRAYAALVRAGDGNELERLELLTTHRGRVLAELAEVRAHLDAIDAKIGIYTDRIGPTTRSA